MMYEAYEKKVRGYLRHVKIFKICVKSAVIALLAGIVCTLGILMLRGIHFGPFTLKDETVAFGDKPSYDCFVLFSTYECEYALPDSEVWFEEQPVEPGEYRVRAVITKGFWGEKVYSEESAVVLYCRDAMLVPTAIRGTSVPYGEEPVYGKHWEIPSAALANGHYVAAASLLGYEYDGNGNMIVHVNPSSIMIRDSKGNDVTRGYEINQGSGSLKVKAKELTVVVADKLENGKPVTITKEYDGKSVATDKYTITSGELLVGDSLSVTPVSGQILNAGTHTYRVNVNVYHASGQNRSAYYDIKVESCQVVIEKRKLTVTTPDLTLEYSGNVQYPEEYSITAGSLAPGQRATLVFDKDTAIQEITTRPAENKVKLTILSGGADVTKNYDITYHYGSLNVVARTLRVRTSDSAGLTYNGQAQSWTRYEILSGSLGSGHRLVPKNAATLTEPGSCENRVEYVIQASDGSDVTKNYKLSVEYGTLVVAAGGATVRFSLQTLSKTYDSRPLTPADYDASALYRVTSGQLFGNDYLEITGTSGSQTDAGQSNYTIQYRIMHKTSKGEIVDATSWYNSSIASEGILRVNKRKLTVRFDAINKQYDGQAANPSAPSVTDSALSSMEGIGHVFKLSPMAMDTLSFTKNGRPVDAAVDIGTYTYTIPTQYLSVVLDDYTQADRTENYEFAFEGNKVTITGIDVSLTAPSASKVYDGMPLSADQFSSSDVEVVWGASGYRVTYTLSGEQTDVGTGTVKLERVTVWDASGQNVTTNFNVKTTQGKLTVTPLSIKVQTSSGSKVYDAKPMDNATQLTLISGTLAEGHKLGGAVNSNYVTDVGTHENTCITPKVYSATGKDVSRNYAITIEAGRYTVTPAPLSLGAPLVTGEYTGLPYTGTCDATAFADGLAKGQTVKLEVESAGVELGTHDMKILGYQIRNSRGEDVGANYEVTFNHGQIEIVRRKITLITGGNEVSYDNAPAINQDVTVGGSGLLDGHDIRVVFSFPDGLNEIGMVENSLGNARVVDSTGRDVTRYYDISYKYGKLRVKPIKITLETGSDYKEVYDGYPIVAANYDFVDGALLDGHSMDVTFKYPNGVSNVGEWKNNLSTITITDQNGQDVTYMYDVKVNAGTLEIAQPYRLSMVSYDAQKVYDGKPLSSEDYTLLNALLEGHVVQDVKSVEQVLAGEKDNRLTLVILDQTGSNVSKNYEFYYEEGNLGKLTVTPREIFITLGTAVEFIYNASVKLEVPMDQMTIEGLVEREKVSLVVEVESPEVGTKQNTEIYSPHIYNARGVDVTDSYSISLDAGEFEAIIVPAPLTLYLSPTYSKEYNGAGVSVEQVGYRAQGLVKGHTVQYEATEASAEPNTYTLEFLSYAVYDKNGDDVTQNYDITPRTCTVTIKKKILRLTSESASRHYNGQPLTCETLLPYNLPDYYLDITFTGSQTIIGTSDNTFEVQVYDQYDANVTDYFDVRYTYGELEVWGNIPLSLESESAVKIYDGQPLICQKIKPYSLPEGYKMDVIYHSELATPGEIFNEFEVVIYDQETGEIVTGVFDIDYQFGTLKVLATAEEWEVTLYSKSASKQYDGTALTYYELEPYELPEGFELVDVVFTGSQTEIGSSKNTFTARARNAAGAELTVHCVPGDLTVSVDITVTPYEKTFTYDGTEKNCGPEDFWTQGKPDGFQVVVVFGQGRIVTGTQNVKIQKVYVYNERGQDVTDACNIKIGKATLTVNPKILTVDVYGQGENSSVYVQGSLVEGHTMLTDFGDNGEILIDITDEYDMVVYSNHSSSPIRNVLYDVIIQYG